MKNLKVVLIGFLVFISSVSYAQLNVAATVGIASPILDNGFGVQVGVNPSFELTEYLSLESQFSLIHVNGTQFISGDEFTSKSYNALAGGRLYVLSSKKSFRAFINFLAGANFNPGETRESDLGLSLGVYGEFKDDFLFGIAGETDGFFVGKLGYQF